MSKEELIFLGVMGGVGAIIGALASLGLSCFPALPILAAGAIIAVIPVMLFCARVIYDNYLNNKCSTDDIIMPLILSSISAAIGVGLAAVAVPCVMLELSSAAGFGAAVGAIASIATLAILFMVDKVSECFTSTKVESATPSNGIKKEAAAFQ